MFTGKNSGAIYADSNDFCREVSDFASKFMYHNPLHLDTYKEVSKMEAEVLRMTASLITKNNTYGVITSGGTESLIMTIYAYRKFHNKPKPNMYLSSHSALFPTPYTQLSTRELCISTFKCVRRDSMRNMRWMSSICALSSTATPLRFMLPMPITLTESSTPSTKSQLSPNNTKSASTSMDVWVASWPVSSKNTRENSASTLMG